MILTKTILLNPKTRLKKYYQKLGYDVNKNLIEIDVEHLTKSSHIKIKVKCDVCGKEKILSYVKYIKNISKYNYYSCCAKCARKKLEQTNLKKYGVENPQSLESIKLKMKQTNLERYGVEYSQKSDKVKKKVKQTNLKKYGVENCLLLTENRIKLKEKFKKDKTKIIEKTKQTNLKKYGVEYPQKLEITKKKTKQTNLERHDSLNGLNLKKYYVKILQNIKEKYKDLNIIDFKNKLIKIKCDKCNQEYKIHSQLLIERYKKKNIDICLNCNSLYSLNTSNSEIELLNFIKENYTGKILTSDRKILNGKELDIYLPELKLAFEYNGIYWHNDKNKNSDYHKNKSDSCQEKEIQLIHIWEDEWIYKQDIIKSLILNKLNKDILVFSAKIKEIKNEQIVKDFLNNNHINGYVKSDIKIGVFNKEELVSLMLINKDNSNNYKLLGFCNKINLNVGAENKLFDYFIENHKCNIRHDLDRSLNEFYEFFENRFIFIGNTAPNVYSICNGIRNKNTNQTKHKIYDSGNSKFIYFH